MKTLPILVKYISLIILNILLVILLTDCTCEMIQMAVPAWFTIMDKALRYHRPGLSEEDRKKKIKYFSKVFNRKRKARNKNQRFVDYFETNYIKANKLSTPESHKKYLKCKQNLKELNLIVDMYECIFNEAKVLASKYDKENK